MKKIIIKVISLLICTVLLFSITGCKNSHTSSDGYLELADSPSTTLDNVWYNTGGIFRCAVFDSLLTTDADMKTIKPALAKKYTVSEDGLTFSFVLHSDVTWHDGEVFDAEDVVYSVKAMLRSKEVNGLLSSAFQYIDGAEAYANGESEDVHGISVSENVITFRLAAPVGSFLMAVAQFAILPEHILGSVSPEALEDSDYWKQPVGCGPYKITKAVSDDYFILERYSAYYAAKPGVEKIRLKINIDDPVAAMQNGSLDFYVTNDPEEIAKLKGASNCSSHRLNVLFPAYLIFNLSSDDGVNEYLKDIRVRQALLMAIDRQTIVEVIFPGSTISDTLVPSWDNWYLDGGADYEFNPEKAKQLLTEAGFDFSKTIRLRYFTKGQSTSDLMNSIAVYWRAIGLQVSLEKFEGSGSEHMFQIRDYDVCYKRLSAFDHAAIYEELSGTGVMQNSIYKLPVYDTLIDRLNVTLDEAQRKEIIGQMQLLDQEYLLRLPLFALTNIAYVNDARFEMPEAYGNPWYRYDLHFEDWRLCA